MSPRRRPLVVLARATGSSSRSSPPSSFSVKNLFQSLARAFSRFLRENYLPLGLVLGMTLGFLFPAPGLRAADLGVTSLATAGIFLISGLSLKREEATRALKSWKEVAFGLLSILVITPLLAAPLAASIPLEPQALAAGLGVFFCMPTTLSSGVALTAAAGGDAALALLLTVSSNLLGVITAPWTVATLLSGVIVVGGGGGGGGGGGASTTAAAIAIDPLPLLKALAKTVAAPLVLGAALRSLPLGKRRPIAGFADLNKRRLSYLSAALLASVPWSQVSRAVAGGAVPPLAPLAAAAAAGLLIHSALLLFNLAAVNLLRLGGSEPGQAFRAKIALVICTSQKTLTVAVPAVAALYASSNGASASATAAAAAATAMMPIVLLHMLQTALDGFLVARVASKRDGGGSDGYVMYRF